MKPGGGAIGVLGINVLTTAGAQAGITTANNAINSVSNSRADLGIAMRNLQGIANGLNSARINLSAARSRIQDADMAAEFVDMSRSNITANIAGAFLAHANEQPRAILDLLTSM